MKRYIIAAMVAVLSLAMSAETVYICTGPQSKRYHKTNACWGLNSCSKSIVALDKAAAKKRGKTPCKVCYGGNRYNHKHSRR